MSKLTREQIRRIKEFDGSLFHHDANFPVDWLEQLCDLALDQVPTPSPKSLEENPVIATCDRALFIHGLPAYSALAEALRAVLTSVPFHPSHLPLKARIQRLLGRLP